MVLDVRGQVDGAGAVDRAVHLCVRVNDVQVLFLVLPHKKTKQIIKQQHKPKQESKHVV